jgi:hypothetical protein
MSIRDKYLTEIAGEFGVIDSLKQLQDVSNDLYKTCSKWNFDDPKDRESFRKELNRIATSILQLKKTFSTGIHRR